MTRLSLLSLAAMVAVIPFRAAPAQPLTVFDALERVESHHPDLGRLRAALTVNRGRRALGYGFDAPVVSYAREGIDAGGFTEQRLVFGQSIDSPIASYFGRRRMDAEAAALRLDVTARQALLRGTVKKAFIDVMFAERLIELRMEAVGLSRQLLEAARLRESAGEAAGLETMRAEISLAEAEASLVEARRLRTEADLAVAEATSLDDVAAVESPDVFTYRPVEVTREEVVGGIGALPEALRSRQHVAAARLGVREAVGSLFPDLAVEIFPQDFGNGFDRFGFQVGLRVPLPGTPAYRGARAVAKAQLDDQEWAHQATASRLAAEAEAAWTGYVAARTTALQYQEVIGPRADTLEARTREGYLLGEVPLFTLLDAQRTALSVGERAASALRDYMHRLVDLERFTGHTFVFPEPSPLASDPR